MAKVKITGHASGTGVLTVTAPNTSTDRTITLPDSTGTLATTADTGVAGITSAADATAINILSNERVGINKTTPDARLDISAVNETALRAVATVSGEYAAVIQSASTNTTPILSLRKSGGTETVRFSSEGGILFNGDTAAANALDDYEEGTWTPTYTSSGSGLSVNYNTQAGHYVKVGKLVTCTVQINTSSVSGGSASHTLRLEGLPFTHNNSSPGGFRFGAAYGWNNLEPDVAQLSGGMLLFIDDAGDWVHTNTLQTSNDRNHAYSNFTYEIN